MLKPALALNLSFSKPMTGAIYGSDDRRFVATATKEKSSIRELSSAIAIIISKNDLVDLGGKIQISTGLLSENSALNICSDLKFANHHSINACTGFLVSSDIFLSAGHCFYSQFDCENKAIIFNVLESSENNEGYKVNHQQVYSCKKIVKTFSDSIGQVDYSIVQLDRIAEGVKPLKLSVHSTLGRNDSVFMIGHPLGLPQVISSKAVVTQIFQDLFFKATLDSFEGNSGSPVFNSISKEVEGILVSGEDDFQIDDKNSCNKYKTYSRDDVTKSGKGESIMRIGQVIKWLKK